MQPNGNYDPRPEYMQELIKSTGLTKPELCEVLACDRRTIERWVRGDRKFTYRDQFTVESIVLGV